jgi:hypothetical protein
MGQIRYIFVHVLSKSNLIPPVICPRLIFPILSVLHLPLQEVFKLYGKELPMMSYAANTGRESPFVERCVTSG